MQALILALFALLFGFVSYAAGSANCGGSEWRYSLHSNKCYRLFNAQIAWPMAEFRCVFQGAHHISVHDSNDNFFLSELAKQAGIVWLGAAQFGASKDYVWSDGTPFSFEHWKDNHRPIYHKGKKCSKLDGATGAWLQSCCKVPAAYICQKPALQLPSIIVEEPLSESDPEANAVEDHQKQLNNNTLRIRAARIR